MKRKDGAAVFIALLLVISLARLALVSAQPFENDSAVYAEMAREMIAQPSLVPGYLGNPVPWKPPAAIWLYAAVGGAAGAAFPSLPIEVALRAGPALASIACAFALFAVGRRLSGARDAFLAAMVFLTANEALAVAHIMFLDTVLVLFVLLALYSYMRSLEDRRWLAAAFAFSALAGLTKTYAALLSPLLGLAYYYSFSPRTIRSPAFIASLLAVPLAILGYAVLFSALVPNGAREIIALYLYDAVGRVFVSGPGLLQNLTDLFRMAFPWSLLPVAGAAALSWRKPEDRFLLAWTVLSLIPLLGQSGFFWYQLPIIPVVALLSVRALSLLKPGHLWPAFALLLILSLANYEGLVPTQFSGNGDQAATGRFLAGECGSTLIISGAGVPAVTFYRLSSGECAGYSSLRQAVAEPYAMESYVAYPSMWELSLEKIGHSCVENATAGCIRSEMAGYENVAMERRFYEIYSEGPLPDYSPAFFSPHGEFVVLRRAQ